MSRTPPPSPDIHLEIFVFFVFLVFGVFSSLLAALCWFPLKIKDFKGVGWFALKIKDFKGVGIAGWRPS